MPPLSSESHAAAVQQLTALMMFTITSSKICNISGDTEVIVEKLLKAIYAHLRKMNLPERVRCSRIHEIVSFAFLKSLHQRMQENLEIYHVLLKQLPKDISEADFSNFLVNIDIKLFRPVPANNLSAEETTNKPEYVIERNSAFYGDILSILHDGRSHYMVRSGDDILDNTNETYTYSELKRRQRRRTFENHPNRAAIYLPEVYIVGSPWCLPNEEYTSWDDMEDRSMFDLLLTLTYFRELGNAVYRWAFPQFAAMEGKEIDTEMLYWTYAIEKHLFIGNIIYGLGELSEFNDLKRKEFDEAMDLEEASDDQHLQAKKAEEPLTFESKHSWAELVNKNPVPTNFKQSFHQNEYLVHVGFSNDPDAMLLFPKQGDSPTAEPSPTVHYPMKAYELTKFFKEEFPEVVFPPRRFFDSAVTAGFSWDLGFTFFHSGFGRDEDMIGRHEGAWDFEVSRKGIRRSRWWMRRPALLANFRATFVRFA